MKKMFVLLMASAFMINAESPRLFPPVNTTGWKNYGPAWMTFLATNGDRIIKGVGMDYGTVTAPVQKNESVTIALKHDAGIMYAEQASTESSCGLILTNTSSEALVAEEVVMLSQHTFRISKYEGVQRVAEYSLGNQDFSHSLHGERLWISALKSGLESNPELIILVSGKGISFSQVMRLSINKVFERGAPTRAGIVVSRTGAGEHGCALVSFQKQ